jgi:hypothetical protein
MTTTSLAVAQSQDTVPGQKTDPEVKWNVMKQYDEHGNLIYYDSSCVHTWNHFDFPGPEGGNSFRDLDSLFGDFFQFPDAFMPFEDFFPPSFLGPDDSLYQFHPKWQQLPQQKKKPARSIEI